MLAVKYDEIFPVSESAVSLIKEITPGHGSVLDVGSATGQYVSRLRHDGYNAFGLEYSPEIIKYRENTVVGDMTFPPYKPCFDTVVCCGNTLAHVNHYPHAVVVMRSLFSMLKPQGKALIQILNYEKILSEKPFALPEIKTQSCTFERHYDYNGDNITFTGHLSCDGRRAKSSVQLYPLLPKELLELGFRSGFRTVEFFGGFDRSGFDMEDSFMLIALMSK